jgi:RHS repeat-associated protein
LDRHALILHVNRITGNVKNSLYADHLGSIVATANASGTSTTINTYGPFGENAQTTPDNNRFGYTGQQQPKGLGLNYYKARVYSPALGRFLQTDPIGVADDLNLYSYVGGNPVNGTDPSGTFVWFVPVVTGAIGAASGGAGYVIGNRLTGTPFTWKNFGIAVGVGAVAGAAAPFTGTTLVGAALTGATANVVQGGITAIANSSGYTPQQAALDAVSGAVGGGIGGAFAKSVGYGKIGTALPGAVAESNAVRDLSRNVTVENILRNILGNTTTTTGGAIPLTPSSSTTTQSASDLSSPISPSKK